MTVPHRARYASSLGALLVLALAAAARADGVMVYRDRELFREGPADRGYCDPDGSGSAIECDRVLTKVLSGYSYGRGHVTGGLAIDSGAEAAAVGLGMLRISLIESALPGGAIALLSADGALGEADTRRLRWTLVDGRGLFFCRDAHSGELVAPVIGMLTRACEPDAVVGIDVGLFTTQWDAASDRLLAEWVRLGPAFELLGNGNGHAHSLRSVQIGVPLDARTHYDGERMSRMEASLGVGLRISVLYRTPHWETRASVRHRAALSGGSGVLAGHGIEGEWLLLHNFFFSDAVVMQAGLSLRASASQKPERALAFWPPADRHASGFAGLYLGWVHEAPGI